MSSVEVYIIAEGQTEQTFIRDVLAPEMSRKGIYLHHVLIGDPGHKGGNIRFDRAKKDIGLHLKQRENTLVSTMFDYYGIAEDWPGKSAILQRVNSGTICSAIEIAEIIEVETQKEIINSFPDQNPAERFMPYFGMHEFEALLFSNPSVLADKANIAQAEIDRILAECKEPEEIDDGLETAPSKRLLCLKPDYAKVTMGKVISEAIGIKTMRDKCPNFNRWLTKIESLV